MPTNAERLFMQRMGARGGRARASSLTEAQLRAIALLGVDGRKKAKKARENKAKKIILDSA